MHEQPKKTKTQPGWPKLSSSYADLGRPFCVASRAQQVTAPGLVYLNASLADWLGLDAAWLGSRQGLAWLCGNAVAPGSQPVAMAYAGHQFGGLSPQLGDGRALLLGEVGAADGELYDVHLKGSGPTIFSRNGDGRAALGPVLREVLISTAMAALGVPTTHALAALCTGEQVQRTSPLPGGILVRVARGHVRIGSLEFLALRGQLAQLQRLADYTLARWFPQLAGAANPYSQLLGEQVRMHAHLVACWMQCGFIHGVMNTDNASLTGETIDYGPCAFLDEYNPAQVYSSIDHSGRYAYANQPAMAKWNLCRLAEALIPLLHSDGQQAVTLAQQQIDSFDSCFADSWLACFGQKLGLSRPCDKDKPLIDELLQLMALNKADFTNTWRAVAAAETPGSGDAALCAHFPLHGQQVHAWLSKWRARLAEQGDSLAERAGRMRTANPAIIPRNHLVEEALRAAEQSEYGPFNQLCKALQQPFADLPPGHVYSRPPRPEQRVRQTFCGT